MRTEWKVCCGASILVGVHSTLKRFLEGISGSGASSGEDPSPLDTCSWVLG